MRKKRFIFLISFLLGISGCGTDSKKEKVTVSEHSSPFQQISMEEAQDMVLHKEDGILLISSKDCIHCQDLKENLKLYIEEHQNLIFKELELSSFTENDDQDEVEKVKEFLPDYTMTTPEIFGIHNQEVVKLPIGTATEQDVDRALVEYGFLSEQEALSAIKQMKPQISEYLNVHSLSEIVDLLEQKESFYLYISMNDLVNERFTDTLVPYLKENNQNLIELNFSDISSSEEDQSAYQKLLTILGNNVISPSIYKIEHGERISVLSGNAKLNEIKKWFET